MKVLALIGRPRKGGNTDILAEHFLEGARHAGAETDKVYLDDRHIRPIAEVCDVTSKREDPRADDDFPSVLEGFLDADVVVLASPVYWHGPTAQLKVFTDRMFSLVKFEGDTVRTPLEGATVAVIGTGGGGMDDGLTLFAQGWRTASGHLGLAFESLLVPFAPQDPEATEGNAELREQAAALGRKLAGA